jgi:hypothetical protein
MSFGVVSISGVRLALFAAFVVALTYRLYVPKPEDPPAPELYKGAMSAAIILAVLALFNDPGFLGGIVAIGSIVAAAAFLFSR